MARTIDEIAEELTLDRPAAEGLIAFLRCLDLVKFRGERPSPSGRGKGAHVYDVVSGAAREAANQIRRLEK